MNHQNLRSQPDAIHEGFVIIIIVFLMYYFLTFLGVDMFVKPTLQCNSQRKSKVVQLTWCKAEMWGRYNIKAPVFENNIVCVLQLPLLFSLFFWSQLLPVNFTEFLQLLNSMEIEKPLVIKIHQYINGLSFSSIFCTLRIHLLQLMALPTSILVKLLQNISLDEA